MVMVKLKMMNYAHEVQFLALYPLVHAHIFFTLIASYFSIFFIAGLNYYTMTLNNQKIVNLTRMQHRSCRKGVMQTYTKRTSKDARDAKVGDAVGDKWVTYLNTRITSTKLIDTTQS